MIWGRLESFPVYSKRTHAIDAYLTIVTLIITMSISFKPTTYNKNMFMIEKFDQPIVYCFTCDVTSLIRTDRKNTLNVVLREKDALVVRALDKDINNSFDNYATCFEDPKLNKICIPTQYNRIQIPLKTLDMTPLLAEHIVEGVEVIITLSPSKVIRQHNQTICTWLCKDLIANIKYT